MATTAQVSLTSKAPLPPKGYREAPGSSHLAVEHPAAAVNSPALPPLSPTALQPPAPCQSPPHQLALEGKQTPPLWTCCPPSWTRCPSQLPRSAALPSFPPLGLFLGLPCWLPPTPPYPPYPPYPSYPDYPPPSPNPPFPPLPSNATAYSLPYYHRLVGIHFPDFDASPLAAQKEVFAAFLNDLQTRAAMMMKLNSSEVTLLSVTSDKLIVVGAASSPASHRRNTLQDAGPTTGGNISVPALSTYWLATFEPMQSETEIDNTLPSSNTAATIVMTTTTTTTTTTTIKRAYALLVESLMNCVSQFATSMHTKPVRTLSGAFYQTYGVRTAPVVQDASSLVYGQDVLNRPSSSSSSSSLHRGAAVVGMTWWCCLVMAAVSVAVGWV
ncbi:hypothetical protein V8C86DRAFT_1155030 [Haematococcus lacustris]